MKITLDTEGVVKEWDEYCETVDKTYIKKMIMYLDRKDNKQEMIKQVIWLNE